MLIGDAKATAHFSIGSGTKLAMEDAIALYEAFRCDRRPRRRAPRWRTSRSTRREEVEKTQHSADVSLVWFEHVKRFWDMDPTRFAFGLMTRSKAITYDNLALRAPEFVKRGRPGGGARRRGRRASTSTSQRPSPPMFQPFRLRGMTLANRVVVSPMGQYSAVDGVPTDWHLVHYGSRAIGGAGLMFTEMTCVSARRAHHARLHRHVQRRAGGGLEAHRRFRPRQLRARSSACSSATPAAKGATKLMWEGMDQPLARRAAGRSSRPRRCPISRTARCRAR